MKADHGISHRDIKPGNLYKYNGAYAVGDFGLATFPDKEALTEGQDRLGPLYFQAPETLNHPETAKGEPADVYAPAKSLWVLATGDRWPQPGPQRRDNPISRLGTYINHPRIIPLELLLERATHLDPMQRPSLAAIRDELRAWLAGSVEPSATPDLTSLLDTFHGLTDLDRRRRNQAAEDNDLLTGITNRIQERFGPLRDALKKIDGTYFEDLDAGSMGAPRLLTTTDPRYPKDATWMGAIGKGMAVRGPLFAENAQVIFITVLAVAPLQNSEDYVAAAHMLSDPFPRIQEPEWTVLWFDSAVVMRRSVVEENAIDRMAGELLDHLPKAFETLLKRVAQRS